MQFYETYRDQPKLAPLLRELSWTHNLAIMSRCKRDEEREFYLRLASRETWAPAGTPAATRRRTCSSAWSYHRQNSHHRCRNCIPMPPRSSRIAISSSSSSFRRRSLRGRPRTGAHRAPEAVLDRTRPRLLLRRQPVPDPGRRAGLRPRFALLQPGAQRPGRFRTED